MHTSSFILTVAALATSMMRRRSRWRHAGELQRAAHEGTDEMAVDGLLYSDKTPELAKAVVILLHGSGGWSDAREGHYAGALLASGCSTVGIDTLGPRGIGRMIE